MVQERAIASETYRKALLQSPIQENPARFMEDEATDAHSLCIYPSTRHIRNGREAISLLPFHKRVPWPELPKPRAAASPLNDGQQTIVFASIFV